MPSLGLKVWLAWLHDKPDRAALTCKIARPNYGTSAPHLEYMYCNKLQIHLLMSWWGMPPKKMILIGQTSFSDYQWIWWTLIGYLWVGFGKVLILQISIHFHLCKCLSSLSFHRFLCSGVWVYLRVAQAIGFSDARSHCEIHRALRWDPLITFFYLFMDTE